MSVNTLRLSTHRINLERLMGRIHALGAIGALEGGGVCRLAFTEEDRKGRDQVTGWMRELGLDVSVDRIGNVMAVRQGAERGPPVTMGSHIDTVAGGGLYDGSLGVLAGLEVISVLNDAGIETRRPLAVGFFSNEEGARFQPDMMGSGVHQGALDLEEMLAVEGVDGSRVAEQLQAIGYAGDAVTGEFRTHCFVELHVEQGPLLEAQGMTIGVVTGVQGISWSEYRIQGVSNHAGTTPMRLRHDAGYAAAAIVVQARALAVEFGGNQVATVGVSELKPNLINVIANQALLTVDLRNTDAQLLNRAQTRMRDFITTLAAREGVEIQARTLAQFAPVHFATEMIEQIEATANVLGHSSRRLPSGAGHDAQMFAPNCPTAMIFVPSQNGISHNIQEHTDASDIQAGANVLLQVVLNQAG